MAITAAMVKELREMSGAGMMDCKKALSECDGNMDEALEFLKKSGAAKAVKKASRIAAEGICRTAVADGKAAVVEVNSETDFVAKNETFQAFVETVAAQALDSASADVDDVFMAETWKDDPAKTVNDALVEKIATIGEKLSIRRFKKIEAPIVVDYIHGGGRIGVILGAEGSKSDAVTEALKNIAMQIAAMNPQYVSRDDISADEMAKLKEITIDSALNDPASLPKPILQKLLDKAVNDKLWSEEDLAAYEKEKSNKFLFNFLSDAAKTTLAGLAMEGKADYVNDKIFSGLVDGRISKQVKEISLLDQVYVKAEDGKQTVAAYLKGVAADLKITGFVRFETGEGLEKKNEDFAAEVAAQLG
ncbi:MAG: translation elongation factor Ts [Lachnospiraceae bacterium]|nr:translation elongation factor Ts [Lachnospiraceae bacterium]